MSFWGDAAHPAHSSLHYAPQWNCYSIVLSRGYGNLMFGGQKLIRVECLRRSVLYGTVEPFVTGKSINHTVPLPTEFNVTGPHAVVLSVSFHHWRRVFSKPICETTFCLRCEAFADNCTCRTIWVMTPMMTYSEEVPQREPTAATGPPTGPARPRAVTQVTVKARLRKRDLCADGGLCVYSTCQQQICSCSRLVITPKKFYAFATASAGCRWWPLNT